MKKKKTLKKRYFRMCPKCKSLDVKCFAKNVFHFYASPPSYKCNKCGYTSTFFPEIDMQDRKLKGKKKKTDKNENGTG